jgi:Carboxypeptidase regulatory-like domain
MKFSFVVMLVVFAATSALAQQRFDSGPFKGFIKEEPPLNTKEIPHAFEVPVISGTLTFGEHTLADAFFEIRDSTGQVFTTKTDEQGVFSIANPKPGHYDFKATKNGFESVVGSVIVSSRAPRKNRIRVQLSLGT